jgi:hypothetical protein
VDFILGAGEVAIEVKGSSRVDDSALRGLRAFIDEHHPRRAIVVSTEAVPRAVSGVRIVPWRTFMHELWAGAIVR